MSPLPRWRLQCFAFRYLGCTAAVAIGKKCHLKHLNREFKKEVLTEAKGHTTCIPVKAPSHPPPPPSVYPPLPKPNINEHATYPPAMRLETGFPQISVASPQKLGFPGVKREGFAGVKYDKICQPNGRTFPIPTNDWWVPLMRPAADATTNYAFPIPYLYDGFNAGIFGAVDYVDSSRQTFCHAGEWLAQVRTLEVLLDALRKR